MHIKLNFPTVAIYAMKWDVPELIASGQWGANQQNSKKVEADEADALFSVILESAGAKKIDVIKLVRELTGQGLAESKAVVESLPRPIKTSVSKDEAELVKDRFLAIGATVLVELEK